MIPSILLRQWHTGVSSAITYAQRRWIASTVKTLSARPKKKSAPSASLAQQLFPSIHRQTAESRQDPQSTNEREVPRLPLDVLSEVKPSHPHQSSEEPSELSAKDQAHTVVEKSTSAEHQFSVKTRGRHTSVLRLENASKHLTISDFRRVIPQGKHIEGWSLTTGDIIKVIPDRNAWTLAQGNFYYLLFSTPYSAHVYHNHAKHLHALAKQHGNGNAFYGQSLDALNTLGIDIESAVANWTMMSTSQTLQLQHLWAPLRSDVEALLQSGGLPQLKERPHRKPFELRLTLEGPQIELADLRYSLVKAGIEREIPWSGNHHVLLHLSIWNPRREKDEAIIMRPLKAQAQNIATNDAHTSQAEGSTSAATYKLEAPVYIVGFDSEDAAQNFLHYWHKRQLAEPGDSTLKIGNEMPPVLHLEMLW